MYEVAVSIKGRRWFEAVDLPLLLSQTKYNRSLAADGADVDRTTHDVVTQSGAGGLPKLDIPMICTTLQYQL